MKNRNTFITFDQNSNLMKLQVVKSGEKFNIILTKNLVEKYHLEQEVEVEEVKEGILLKSPSIPREGWEQLFRSAKSYEDSVSNEFSVLNENDDKEWTW